MQFSDTSTKLGIIQECERLCQLGDTGISGNTTLLYQFTGLCNRALGEIAAAIRMVDKNNKWDDYNYADYPDAPITMVLNQQDYTIPVASTGASVNTNAGIKGIYFLNSDNSRTYLDPMLPTDKLDGTSATPTKYKLDGKSIFFNCPIDSATMTQYSSTFYVEFQRSASLFVYTDTTKEPGFPVDYHYLVPLRASAWYLKPTDLQLATDYQREFLSSMPMLLAEIANFDGGNKQRMTVAQHDNK